MEEQNKEAQPQQPAGEAPKANQADIDANKALAIVGYILPILFFIPLLGDAKNSPFAKFHANQQLNLLIAAIAVNVVGTFIPILGWFIILPFGSLALIIIAIIGVIGAAKGDMKPLPLIGGFQLIK